MIDLIANLIFIIILITGLIVYINYKNTDHRFEFTFDIDGYEVKVKRPTNDIRYLGDLSFEIKNYDENCNIEKIFEELEYFFEINIFKDLLFVNVNNKKFLINKNQLFMTYDNKTYRREVISDITKKEFEVTKDFFISTLKNQNVKVNTTFDFKNNNFFNNIKVYSRLYQYIKH